MGPGTRHRFCDLRRIQVCEDLLDAPQLRNGVDTVCSERVNQLILIILWRPLANLATGARRAAQEENKRGQDLE